MPRARFLLCMISNLGFRAICKIRTSRLATPIGGSTYVLLQETISTPSVVLVVFRRCRMAMSAEKWSKRLFVSSRLSQLAESCTPKPW